MNGTPNYKRTKFACYTAYFTMSSVFCVPPLLFVTLRDTYGISYTLLGTLVLVTFVTQLAIDLVFTLFSKHFNTALTVRVMPVITALGLFVFAAVPMLFPELAYFGLVLGTVIFSISAGLSEVLLSPTIAAIPSDNPQRDMSFLHSLYAFGVLFMVVFSTVFLRIFGTDRWMWLVFILALFPLVAAIMFMISPMPDMTGGEGGATVRNTKERAVALALFFGCIFFGSCAECAMSSWISGFMENAVGIDKTLGDIIGAAGFAVLLGIVRFSYSRFGKSISPILLVGMIGSTVCYIVVGLSGSTVLSIIACVFTGLFSSMLWPGTLILMEEKLKAPGVTAFALLAAGGDLGASVSPQLMGIVIDTVSASGFAAELAPTLGISAEQLGLRVGMLTNALFPILGIAVLLITFRYCKKHKKTLSGE